MIRFVLAAAGTIALIAAASQASAASVSGGISVTISPPVPPLVETINPAATTIACETPPGTTVGTATVSGGTGGAITLTLSGDTTDFALSGTTPPANVVVAPGGIIAADCDNMVHLVTVTASQP